MTELNLIVCAIKNIKTSAELVVCRFFALTDLLKVATLICDRNGRITSVNQQGLKMLHASEAEVLNLQVDDVLQHARLGLVDRMKMQPGSLGTRLLDDFLIDTRGAKQPVSMLVHPLDLAESESIHVACLVDLTVNHTV